MILIKLQENAKNIGVAVKGYFSLSDFFSYLSSSGESLPIILNVDCFVNVQHLKIALKLI